MQVLKILAVGTLFLLLIVIAHTSINALSGKTRISHTTAVSLSALTGGLMEGTVLNPYFWLTLVVAYGAAIWVVKA